MSESTEPRVVCGVGKAKVSPALLRLVAASQSIGSPQEGAMTDARLGEIGEHVRGYRENGFNGPLFVWLEELHAEVSRVRGRPTPR